MRLHPQLARALKVLKEVERREWYAILLDSANPISEGSETVKLVKVAAAYKVFSAKYPMASIDLKREAYRILRVAFDGGLFPHRKHLSKVQFGELLDLHLHYEQQ